MTAYERLRECVDSTTHGFSVGSFGATGEFSRDTGEKSWEPEDGRLGRITARGGLAFGWRNDLRPVAWESLSKARDHWQHGVVFCLPRAAARLPQAAGITELGPDHEALRTEDREDILFDLGLNQGFVNVGIRTADHRLLKELRAAAGSQLLAPGNPVLPSIIKAGPHRVFTTVIGRLEVFQPIGIERSPDGPHTHVLPKLLAKGRAHSANIPVPREWLPVLSLHPAHPCRSPLGKSKPFELTVFDDFQQWLALAGPTGFLEQKRATWSALAEAVDPADFDPGSSRMARTATRVALRQYGHFSNTRAPLLDRWQATFDGGRTAADRHHRDQPADSVDGAAKRSSEQAPTPEVAS
ncbi:MAG: hypothetical protein AAGI67_20520 [Pseudomonadota bacterium]